MRTAIEALAGKIRADTKNWSFSDKQGVAFHFVGDRLFKQNNVVNRSGMRTRFEIRNLQPFFNKLHANLLQCPFVKVSYPVTCSLRRITKAMIQFKNQQFNSSIH